MTNCIQKYLICILKCKNLDEVKVEKLKGEKHFITHQEGTLVEKHCSNSSSRNIIYEQTPLISSIHSHLCKLMIHACSFHIGRFFGRAFLGCTNQGKLLEA